MLAETFIIISVMFIAIMGPVVVMTVLGYAVIKAISRNPSAVFKIFLAMAIMVIFVEALSIVAIMVIFQLFAR